MSSSYYSSSSFPASAWQAPEDEYDHSNSDSDHTPPVYTTDSSSDKDGESNEGSHSDSTSDDHAVYILRFTQPFPGLHWSIFVQDPGEITGISYDVHYDHDVDVWERKRQRVEYIDDETLIWEGGRQVERYHDRTLIGLIDDVEELERVMDETPVPVGVSEDENCQAWVGNVVDDSVTEGLFKAGVIDNLPLFD